MPNELIVSDLCKHYGPVAALKDVSFSVAAGEIFALLGRNGAGKTTAIECIVGLRVPDAGTISIAGVDARKNPGRAKTHFGAQLQSTALQDKITPREALRLFASFYPQSEEIGATLGQFGLTEKADEYFATLSAGQRQRLGLALAVVHKPRLVFLDEPTAGLDAAAVRDLHQLIRRQRGEGRALVLTTHNIAEAAALADRIAILEAGRIIAAGTAAEVTLRAGELNCPATLEDVFIELTRPGRS